MALWALQAPCRQRRGYARVLKFCREERNPLRMTSKRVPGTGRWEDEGFSLARRLGDGRSMSVQRQCHSPPTATGVLLARVKVQIVEDSESYLSTITGTMAVAGHLICFHPGFPLVNEFGEDIIFRRTSRHPVQI